MAVAWRWLLIVVVSCGIAASKSDSDMTIAKPRQVVLKSSGIYEGTTIEQLDQHFGKDRKLADSCNYAATHFDVRYENTNNLLSTSTYATVKAATDAAFCIWADILSPFANRCKFRVGFATSSYWGNSLVIGSTGFDPVDFTGNPVTYAGCQLRQGHVPGHPTYTSTNYDVEMMFNVDYNFYYQKDTTTVPIGATQIDFITVALHEIGHGLGLFNNIWACTGCLSGLDPFTYSPVWRPGSTGYLTTFTQAMVVGSNSLAFNKKNYPSSDYEGFNNLVTGQRGSICVKDGAGNCLKIYTPTVWNWGSSMSHLDEITFPPGSEESLMTPQLGQAEIIRCIGNKLRNVLKNDLFYSLQTNSSSTCVASPSTAPSVTKVVMYDAGQSTATVFLDPLSNISIINLRDLTTGRAFFRAITNPTTTGSVKFSPSFTASNIDSSAPYDSSAFTFTNTATRVLNVTVYDASGATGTAGALFTRTFQTVRVSTDAKIMKIVRSSSAASATLGPKYTIFYLVRTWADAKTYCISKGGKLAMPKTSADYLAMKRYLPEVAYNSWIGVRKVSDVWKFVDDTNVTTTYWGAGETGTNSTELCVGAVSKTGTTIQLFGQWLDQDCTTTQYLICEK